MGRLVLHRQEHDTTYTATPRSCLHGRERLCLPGGVPRATSLRHSPEPERVVSCFDEYDCDNEAVPQASAGFISDEKETRNKRKAADEDEEDDWWVDVYVCMSECIYARSRCGRRQIKTCTFLAACHHKTKYELLYYLFWIHRDTKIMFFFISLRFFWFSATHFSPPLEQFLIINTSESLSHPLTKCP
jgi:hypothetical protein